MQKMSIEESIINLLINVIGKCSVKKALLKNSQKFLGKLQCRSLFLNKIADLTCNFIRSFQELQEFSYEFLRNF